jgi:hypothetical protein
VYPNKSIYRIFTAHSPNFRINLFNHITLIKTTMKVTLLTLVLSSLASLAAAADETLPSYCLDGTASAEFFQCSILNSNSCASCDSNNNTESTGFFDCATLNVEFCPLVKCCAACEMETQRFYECNVLPSAALFNPTAATSCSFDCSGFTSPPTLPPADQEPASPCDAETASWVDCALTQGDQCLGCTNSTYLSSLLALAGQDLCSPANSAFCAALGCCSSCQAELTALYQCSISKDLASCDLNCTPTPVTHMASAPAGSPIVTRRCAGKLFDCLASHGRPCTICEPWAENIAAIPDSAVVGQDECNIANFYLCPLLQCCYSCQTESTELYLCVSQDNISSCDLSCSNVPAASPQWEYPPLLQHLPLSLLWPLRTVPITLSS